MQPVNAPPSRLHANVLFGKVDVKLNVALVLLLGLAGPEVIVVSGAVVSGEKRKIVPLPYNPPRLVVP